LDRQAFYAEGLASIMSRKGDLESARGQYEKIVSLTTGRLTAGDAYAKSLFQLGRIYQEKEDPATAREFFRKYLAARGEADPGLDEVEEARKRLASIS
jgi:tetratricopeptide (TPR) repeat protein